MSEPAGRRGPGGRRLARDRDHPGGHRRARRARRSRVPALRHAFDAAIRGDTAEVRDELDGLGVAGPLLILGLALIHAVVFYPAEIVDAAAGFVYGFLPALALVMAGWLLSGLLCYAVGASVARPLLDRWFGAERFERIEAMIERGGATLLIAVRLIPIVPFSLVSYAAGAARVPLWRFVWTTAVGYLPITALAVYFGTRLEGLSLTDPLGARQRRRRCSSCSSSATGSRGASRGAAASPSRRACDLEAETAGVASTLPAASTALTRTAWRPAPKRRARRSGAEAAAGRRRSGR